MLSLCWPWKAPQSVALGPALMMRLMTAAAASAAEDGGVSWWPRSTLEQQGAGATAAGKPTRAQKVAFFHWPCSAVWQAEPGGCC